MLEMNVFVGLKDPDDLKDILVQPDPAAAHSGDEILWRVHCLDPKVATVEIDFGPAGGNFFQSDDPSRDSQKCTKKMRGGKGGNQGNMWGVAPNLNGAGAKKDKYIIRALASNGDLRHELDPTIVTVDP